MPCDAFSLEYGVILIFKMPIYSHIFNYTTQYEMQESVKLGLLNFLLKDYTF